MEHFANVNISEFEKEIERDGVLPFLIARKILSLTKMCKMCGGDLQLQSRGADKDPVYLCTTRVCLNYTSVRIDTFFAPFDPRLKLTTIFLAGIQWLKLDDDEFDLIIAAGYLKVPRPLMSATFDKLRTLIARWLVVKSTPIGGANCNVQVGVCPFYLLPGTRWIACGMCKALGETFFVPVADPKSVETTQIIKQYVREGSKRLHIPRRVDRLEPREGSVYLVQAIWKTRSPTKEMRLIDYTSAISYLYSQ